MVYREHLIFRYELGIISTIKCWGPWEVTSPASLVHRATWEPFSKEPKEIKAQVPMAAAMAGQIWAFHFQQQPQCVARLMRRKLCYIVLWGQDKGLTSLTYLLTLERIRRKSSTIWGELRPSKVIHSQRPLHSSPCGLTGPSGEGASPQEETRQETRQRSRLAVSTSRFPENLGFLGWRRHSLDEPGPRPHPRGCENERTDQATQTLRSN